MRKIKAADTEGKTVRSVGCGGLLAIGKVHYYKKQAVSAFKRRSGSAPDAPRELTRLQIAFAEKNDGDDSGDGTSELLFGLARKHVFEGFRAEEATEKAAEEISERTGRRAAFSFSFSTRKVRKKAADVLFSLCESSDEGANGTDLTLPCKVILVCRDLTPSEITDLDEDIILGLVFGELSPISEEVRTAQSLGLPIITGIDTDELEREAPEGSILILDAAKGLVTVSPSESEIAEYVRRIGALAENGARNGKSIRTLVEVRRRGQLEKRYDGEILLFCNQLVTDDPSENELSELYGAAAGASEGRVTVLLCGKSKETDGEILLRRELRAVLSAMANFTDEKKAAEGACISLLIPDAKSKGEVEHVRAALTEEANGLGDGASGLAVKIKVGALAECPAAVLLCAELSEVCDFVVFDTDALLASSLGREKAQIGKKELDENRKILFRLVRPALSSLSEKGVSVGLCGFASCESCIPPLLVPSLAEVPPDVTKSRFFLVLPENRLGK